ncbi:adenosine deaminase [Rodentibacter caecimuris]|uniref:adenosine deaminase n=1 Tax=Rodentibacter caecimuris TaxID=1796644 RepID=A0ABX3KWM6_9PAST|nr:adenosine deaminase [Rodentibacter heylii]
MKLMLSKYGLIDLHLHLDGSLSPDWIIHWAQKLAIALPTYDAKELLQFISVPKDCSSLNDYLKCFDLPLKVLQTPESLASAVEDLLLQLDKLGLIYAEIRFAPQLHTRQGMTQEQAVKAAIEGLHRGLEKVALFKANLICCCMRGNNNQMENMETIRVAKQFLNKGIVAADLAGAEALFPTLDFINIFDYANQIGVPFTLHAGEAAGAESVKQALDMGAKRIGHGVRAIEQEDVVKQLSERKIPLEMCPCSNLQTRTVNNLGSYPLRTYLKQKLIATLNSDNMTVSKTDVQQEFQLLQQEYQLTEQEALILVNNAVQAAFLSEEDKIILKQKLVEKLGTFPFLT